VRNNQLNLGGGSTEGIETNGRKGKNWSFIDSLPISEDDVDPMAKASRIEHNYPGARFKETTAVFNPDTCHSYLLVLAMAIHSTAAGLALGLQTTFGGTVGLSIALLCHKWAEAMTIGIMFVQENSNPWDAAILIVLSGLATPVGVIIG
jgi:zinc transporter ZupT